MSTISRAIALPMALLALSHCGSADDAAPAPSADDTVATSEAGSDSSPTGDGDIDGASVDAFDASDGALPPKGGTLVGNYTGVNAFVDDPTDLLAPLGTVREYHNWGWIADNYAASPAYPDMKYTFMNFNGWDWDKFFSEMKAKGASAFPAVQGSVPWMNKSAVPPVAAGADKTAAASYVAHADAMFQIAARYGSVKVPDAKLKLASTQTRVSGLGTVQYFEDFNEQDLAAAFTAEAFAAMASADYDGDQGRLGDTFGVKNADPAARLVMGGLSGAYSAKITWVQSITNWLDSMRAWSDAHRKGSFPADVINVHYYSFGPKGAALSPEEDKVQEKLAAVVAYRDKHLAGKEVWWTEFGYDTFDKSVLHAPTIGGNSAFVVQGQWLVRSMLAGLAAGIDRATLYVLRDDCKPGAPGCDATIQFVTCGITSPKGEWAPKPAWFFLTTFRSRLSTMTFSGEQSSGAADVKIFKFRDTASKGGAYVMWAPTAAATEHKGFALTLPAGVTSVKTVMLVDKQKNGVETTRAATSGSVSIDVSETPIIVLVDHAP